MQLLSNDNDSLFILVLVSDVLFIYCMEIKFVLAFRSFRLAIINDRD